MYGCIMKFFMKSGDGATKQCTQCKFPEDGRRMGSLLSQNPGAGGGAGETFRSGCSALTTMLIFGLNSASYCTQSAATAANCTVITVTEVGIKHDWIIFAEKTQIYVLNRYCPRERREVRNLCNCFGRIFSFQFWIHALFDFIFTQSWSSLYKFVQNNNI